MTKLRIAYERLRGQHDLLASFADAYRADSIKLTQELADLRVQAGLLVQALSGLRAIIRGMNPSTTVPEADVRLAVRSIDKLIGEETDQ